MLSCQEATRLMSEARERALRPGERVSLAFHTAICSGCRTFRSQMTVLGELMRRYAAGAGEPPADTQDKERSED